MMAYSVTTPEDLRSLCIRKGWFTGGSNRQYEKLFFANEIGLPLSHIATIIWICSSDEWSRRSILDELFQAHIDYKRRVES